MVIMMNDFGPQRDSDLSNSSSFRSPDETLHGLALFLPANIIELATKLEKQHRSGVQLSETLSSLIILGTQLCPPHTALTSQYYRIERFKGALN